MADKLMRAQVAIPMDSGIPEDVVTNTFYFDSDDGNTDASHWSSVETLLTEFYHAIDGVMFPACVASPAHVKIYDMRDALPRLPEFEFDITLTPTSADPMPQEVALVMSFQAAMVSGV